MTQTMTDKLILVPGSKRHTINSLLAGILTKQDVTIANPYPGLDLDTYRPLLNSAGYDLSKNEGKLVLEKNESVEAESSNFVDSKTIFQVDDRLALALNLKHNMKLDYRRENSEDFERKVLVLRRTGVELAEGNGDQDDAEKINFHSFNPVKIKFNFATSNYNMAETVGLMNSLSGKDYELLADFDLADLIELSNYPLSYELQNLAQHEEEDELAKRLKRLRKKSGKNSFHYRLKNLQKLEDNEIMLPADPMISSFLVISAVCNNSDIALGYLKPFNCDQTFVRILNRLGLKADLQKTSSEKSQPGHIIKVSPDVLTGRKIDEKQMRHCLYAFAPLSIMAMFATGKTILRGLPGSSSKWTSRIDGVARILTSAGARVGEIEDGLVIEPPLHDFNEVEIRKLNDPYLMLTQFTAAVLINREILPPETFSFSKTYPHYQDLLKQVTSLKKSLAS